MTKAAKPVPEGFHTITPQLTLDNAAQTIEWYKKAFGAVEDGRSVGPDGKIMHAALRIGDSPFMVNDVMMGRYAVRWRRQRWAKVEVPIGDQFWGDRGGAVADPAGYIWWIATHKEDLTEPELRQRADEFYKQMATR